MKPIQYAGIFIVMLIAISGGIVYAYPYLPVIEFAILQCAIYTLYALFFVYTMGRAEQTGTVIPL
ncbi:MAG: hypothetical protein M0Q91_16130 [Methanoregula sp.]|jgi:hypothetical protein|nr:hypothetical protein [Methanoregula sp.]